MVFSIIGIILCVIGAITAFGSRRLLPLFKRPAGDIKFELILKVIGFFIVLAGFLIATQFVK